MSDSNTPASASSVAKEKVKKIEVCCVCMDDDDFSSGWSYSCGTCNDGYVCDLCTAKIDPEVTLIIKCPCCRTVNWKYCYSNLFYEMEFDEGDDPAPSPAKALFKKNSLIY